MRQQRRERTHAALHQSALALVQQKGLRATTTDEIVEDAGVSPRTLFNYFASKEDAVLGLRTPVLTERMLQKDADRSHLYIFERVAHLLLDIVADSVDGPTYPQVKALMGDYPELRFRMRTHQLACESVLADFLRTIDWQAFSTVGRRGPFIYRDELTPHHNELEERVQAATCITAALLRYLDTLHGFPPEHEREAMISAAVQTFSHLLREDSP